MTDTLVYCNGDSFISGHGLGLKLLPDFPGELYYNNWAGRTSGRQWADRVKVERNLDKNKELIAYEAAHCFPGLLSKIGYTVINKAYRGASMDFITRTTITDLIEYKKRYKNIVAFVGLTFEDRREFFYYDEWHNINHFSSTHRDEGIAALTKLDIMASTRYSKLISWYLNIINLKNFCRNIGVNLEIINTSIDFVEHKKHSEVDLQNLIDYTNLTCAVEMHHWGFSTDIPGMLPDGHFTEDVHRLVADKLVAILHKYFNVT